MNEDRADSRTLNVWLPPQVKQAVSEVATRNEVSVNDLVGGMLEQSFGVQFSPSGRRCTRAADPYKSSVVLRLSAALVEAIRERAYRRRSNMSAEVVRALAEALGVEIEIVSKRTFPLGGGKRLVA